MAVTQNTYTPKQTAIWLIDNTMLTFEQIAGFCGLHAAEVQAIADGTVAGGMVGENPVMNGELTKEEIARCEKDSAAKLEPAKSDIPKPKARSKGPKYTPVSKRGDKPDAILYMIKHYPEATDAQIVKLIGTTKNTITAIREKTHSSYADFKPRNPADLGLCSYTELEALVEKIRPAKSEEEIAKETAEAQTDETETTNSKSSGGGFDFSNFLGEEHTGS